MSSPAEFARIEVTPYHAICAIDRMNQMLGEGWEESRGRCAWAGFAAEDAMVDAYVPSKGIDLLRRADGLSHDLEIYLADCLGPRIEVKTRVVDHGWTDPRRFDWITVPTHDGREPVKDVEMVFFCWYSGSEPRVLWVLGYVRGIDEFLRRSQFYFEHQPLPRGGWAPKGGAYCIEISQLRPVPRGMFKEVRE